MRNKRIRQWAILLASGGFVFHAGHGFCDVLLTGLLGALTSQ